MKVGYDAEGALKEVHFELLGKLNDTYMDNSDLSKGRRQGFLTGIILIKKKIEELRKSYGP
tara:strand:+ start:248 stop:430 length:183 start_codon:yes stop_codon:yes gene_type:complete